MRPSTSGCGRRLVGRRTWFSELHISGLLGQDGDRTTDRTVAVVLSSICLLSLYSKKVQHPASPLPA
jgi:hypothetical protein